MDPQTINTIGLWILRFLLAIGCVYAGMKNKDGLAFGLGFILFLSLIMLFR